VLGWLVGDLESPSGVLGWLVGDLEHDSILDEAVHLV
jgi:hypothetical protein